MNAEPRLRKGSTVTVKTVNGGLVTGVLDHDYRPTYPVTILRPWGHTSILGYRIVAVMEADGSAAR